jgi:hypothetical protein
MDVSSHQQKRTQSIEVTERRPKRRLSVIKREERNKTMAENLRLDPEILAKQMEGETDAPEGRKGELTFEEILDALVVGQADDEEESSKSQAAKL